MMGRELQEIHVRVTPKMLREELVPAPVELQAYLDAQGVRLTTGQTAEISPEAPVLLAQMLAHFRKASALLIDYGDEAKHLYDANRSLREDLERVNLIEAVTDEVKCQRAMSRPNTWSLRESQTAEDVSQRRVNGPSTHSKRSGSSRSAR